MDFLPVNNSVNERLQYTQSYILPKNSNVLGQNANLQHENPPNSQIRQEDNHPIKQSGSHAGQTYQKNDASGVKIRQDIDDYINRRSHKLSDQSANDIVKRSSRSFIQPNHSVKEIKPIFIESKVETVNSGPAQLIKRSLAPMAETNDNMELPVFRQSSLGPLYPQHILDPLDEISQVRRQSNVVPLHRNLQQSSVNINLQSQVRNYVHPEQKYQSLNVTQDIALALNNKNATNHTRNLKKYEVAQPIIENEKQNYVEAPSKEKLEQSFEVINISQISSNSCFKQNPKQFYKRNLIHNQEPEIIVNHYRPEVQAVSDKIQAPVIQQKLKIDPIVIDNNIELSEFVKSKNNIPLKRHLMQSNQNQDIIKPIIIEPQAYHQDLLSNSSKNLQKRAIEPRKPQESLSMSINSYQSAQLKQHYNGIPLQRSLVLEKPQGPKSINIQSQKHEQSLCESVKFKQKRELQQHKLEQSVPIHLQELMDAQFNLTLKSSLKRNLQNHYIPQQSIEVHLGSQDQSPLYQSQKSTLKRSLQNSYIPQQPLEVHLDAQAQSPLYQSQKSTLKRSLQNHYVPQQNIEVHLDSQSQIRLNQSRGSTLKRNLQNHYVPQQNIEVHLDSQSQIRLNQSQRSILKRNLQASQHQQAIPLHLEADSEHSMRQSLKSSLKRNLQVSSREKSFKAEVEAPIRVQIDQAKEQALYESLKSSLKRNLEAPVGKDPIQVYMHQSAEQSRLIPNTRTLKRSLERQVQQQQQIVVPMEQQPIDAIKHLNQANNDPFNDSIHLSQRLQTIESPKHIAHQRRDLKYIQPVYAYPELSLNEVSHQVADSQSRKQLQELPSMKKSIHLSYDPCEENIKTKAQLLAKRHLKADASIPNNFVEEKQKTCDEGWNPAKNIFKLFKIPISTPNKGQISFTKNRINTAKILH